MKAWGRKNAPLWCQSSPANQSVTGAWGEAAFSAGWASGNHVDNAVRQIPGTHHRLRTDVAATLFLSPQGDYDGGELVIEDTFGTHAAKLGAGDLVI